MHPKIPTATAKSDILMEFVTQIENYSIYWADIYTDGEVGNQIIIF